VNCNRTAWVVLAVVLGPAFCAGDESASVPGGAVATLVEGGRATCSIVVAAPGAQRPAEELATYLLKISGASIPVVPAAAGVAGFRVVVGGRTAGDIEVDATTWEGMSRDGYVIRSSPSALLLTGKTELGMFYAVDAFLEKQCGVRWFMPGDLGEVVPKMDAVRIGRLDETGRPVFRMRWVGRGEWARRNRMNVGVGAEGEFKVKWFVHTFDSLLPPETYGAAHPEYYALVGGKRAAPKGKGDQVQLCTSNLEVIREVAANSIRLKDADPTLDMISVDPMDNLSFCECENCRALDEPGAETNNSLTRRLLIFYNAVAEIVGRKYPDLLLKSIAYLSYVAPPVDAKVRVSSNSVIQFCRFICHNHALTDPGCPYNREYNKYIQGWRQIAGNVAIYEYYYKCSWLELPWPIVHTLRTDIPYFQKLGMFGVATQYGANLGSNGLDYYVAAKLTWDPSLDVDALVADFCTRFYAGASAPMLEYYRTLEDAAVASGVHIARQRSYAEVVALFTLELLAKLDACLTRAESAAGGAASPADSATLRARLELVRTSLEYTEACAEYLRVLAALRKDEDAPWISAALAAQAAEVGAPHVERIRTILNRGKALGATGGPETSYMTRLLDPAGVLRNWDIPEIGFGEKGKSRQKKDWLAESGREPMAPPRPATFAVWLFGNDFDSDDVQSEHDVWLINTAGEKVKIGVLAPVGDAGDKADKCYVITHRSAAEYPRDKLALVVTDAGGSWTVSTVFGVYVMPDEPGLTSVAATERLTRDLNSVRIASLGFIESADRGMDCGDAKELRLEIELAARPGE